MIKEELYIIINGQRKQIDISTPSGITLKWQSNMFNDLSKFVASYSYTFKLPKTKNNSLAFDMIEDVRYISSAYGKRIQCEYIRDGIKLFNNSYLYINEAGSNYSAVMTWNVLDWLKMVSDKGENINELENELAPEELTEVMFRSDKVLTTQSQGFNYKQYYAGYRCGSRYDTNINPPLIPMRYLLDKIAKRYGKTDAHDIFSFVDYNPPSNTTNKNATHRHVADFGVIPLVSGKWSSKYTQSKMRVSESMITREYAATETPYAESYPDYYPGAQVTMQIIMANDMPVVLFGDVRGNKDYIDFWRYKGTDTESSNGMFFGFSIKDKTIPLVLRGRIRSNSILSIKIVRYTFKDGYIQPIVDDDGELVDAEELTSREVEGTDLYEVNFDPEEGGAELTIEEGDTPYSMLAMHISSTSGDKFITDGYLKLMPKRENATWGKAENIDLFSNLPNVKVIDLLKSIFYIEGAYPTIDSDGRIGQMRYKDLYTNIQSGNIYDWSDLMIGEAKNDSVKYTNGNLGQINRYTMSNYSSDEKDDETSLEYASAEGHFATENENISNETTIYSFPFSSAAVTTKDGYSAGDTMIFWSVDDEKLYKAETPNPIIGIVEPQIEGHRKFDGTDEVNEYAVMKTWQVSDANIGGTILAQILKRPFVITTSVFLDVYTLSCIDFTKPVYLQRYNSYFAIISLQMDSKCNVKAELIRLPVGVDMTEGIDDTPEVTISCPSIVYGEQVMAIDPYITAMVETKCRKTKIATMTVKLDGTTVVSSQMDRYKLQSILSYGTHSIEASVTATNGKTASASATVVAKYPTYKIAIDFPTVHNSYTISRSRRNEAEVSAVVYNDAGIASFNVYLREVGSVTRQLMASGTTSTLTFTWPYYKQLSTSLRGQSWIVEAEATDNNGDTATNSKQIYISPDAELSSRYDGAVSPKMLMVCNSQTVYEGGSVSGVFASGDCTFTATLIQTDIKPYYCVLHVKGSGNGQPTRDESFGIDPFDGVSVTKTLAQSDWSAFEKIEVYLEAWFNDTPSTHYIPSVIKLYP